MNNHSVLLEDVINFLNTENIISNDNIISLYDFYKTINSELLGLQKAYIDFDIAKELKKSSILNLKSNPLIIKPCLSSWKTIKDEISTITFEYDYRSYIEFTKGINNSDLNFYYRLVKIKDENAKKFIEQHYDIVLKLMTLLEEYSRLVGTTNYINCYRERINSKMFNVTLKIDNAHLFLNFNPLKFKIEFNPNYENFDYNEVENNTKILRTIDNNNLEILKRIPIDVTGISEPFKSIYLKNIERTKEKQLLIKK